VCPGGRSDAAAGPVNDAWWLLAWLAKFAREVSWRDDGELLRSGSARLRVAPELLGMEVTNYVVAPQRLDDRGKRQKTDRLDARALLERLDRYVRGNRHALAIVRVPSPEQEQLRARVRLREQLAKTRRQFEARGRSALLLQGIRVNGPWWRPARWQVITAELPVWLKEMVSVWQQLAVTLTRRTHRARGTRSRGTDRAPARHRCAHLDRARAGDSGLVAFQESPPGR